VDSPTFDQDYIPDVQFLYRAYLYSYQVEIVNGCQEPQIKAFLRRKTDTKGLSVAPTSGDATKRLRENFGTCRFSARAARASHQGVDVVPDATDHGNVINVPLKEDDREVALKIANALVIAVKAGK
jgi:hypothetical protein